MKAYHISPNIEPVKQRLPLVLLQTACAAGMLVVFDRFVFRRELSFVDVAGFAGVFLLFMLWFEPRGEFDLEIDEAEIRVVRNGSVKEKVKRERVQTVRELKSNLFRRQTLIISEYGAIGSRFGKSVFVPGSLPEYEQVKAQALSWLDRR